MNDPIGYVSSQFKGFFILDETLKLQKFESTNFKYDSSFSELQHKKIPQLNSYFDKSKGDDLKYDNYFCKFKP